MNFEVVFIHVCIYFFLFLYCIAYPESLSTVWPNRSFVEAVLYNSLLEAVLYNSLVEAVL